MTWERSLVNCVCFLCLHILPMTVPFAFSLVPHCHLVACTTFPILKERQWRITCLTLWQLVSGLPCLLLVQASSLSPKKIRPFAPVLVIVLLIKSTSRTTIFWPLSVLPWPPSGSHHVFRTGSQKCQPSGQLKWRKWMEDGVQHSVWPFQIFDHALSPMPPQSPRPRWIMSLGTFLCLITLMRS